MNNILLVDDNIASLMMAKFVLKDKYNITMAKSGLQSIKILQKKRPDLILMDLKMPEMDGRETIKRIKQMEKYKNIPIIVLTAEVNGEAEVECLEIGAADFIMKPFVQKTMISRIERTLELERYRKDLEQTIKEKTNEIEEIQQKIVVSFAKIIENRDGITGDHVKRTSGYVKAIVMQLKKEGKFKDILTEQYVHNIYKSAPLHDIGKIGISDNILCKPGKLTMEEYEIMKEHVKIGGEILDEVLTDVESDNYLILAKDMALYHHERFDGTGYPNGLSREEIPFCARIMAVADVFDALTSRRSYKEPVSIDNAFCIMKDLSGKHFDPLIVEAFLNVKEKIKSLAESYHKEILLDE